ncbi:glutamate 5-kinase [Calocera viscosa TUFC12733]|uniref:Glutamate 5-kinase n=1 Tax=Calocera viscosa (strain TUFC12733) TaxID=1330018 RepID=A0A167GCF0_CALVF|nr:glutamate 5-kinase [Calocera viscosa TUFC12733]
MARDSSRSAKAQRHLTIVIKLGTSSIVSESTHQPLLAILSSIVETVVQLRQDGHRVVLVSSGAIGVGMRRMGVKDRGKTLAGVQALAAIGQGRLIALWDQLFTQLEQPIAQVLLTRGEVSDRTRYLNACNTLAELLSMGVVPIVNENDTVSVSEIKFGDNDTLSAITAAMIHADYLFLMTDVDCLYTANPRKDPAAQPVPVVADVAVIRQSVSVKSSGSALGTGGMETKLIAAELASGAGVTTVITNSKTPAHISTIIAYNLLHPPDAPAPASAGDTSRPLHTVFLPKPSPLADRKWWILHGLHSAGTIVVDEGAHRALSRRESGGRLLPAGVLAVQGTFASQQAVSIVVRRRRSGEHHDHLRRSASEVMAAPTPGEYTPDLIPGTPSSSHAPSAMALQHRIAALNGASPTSPGEPEKEETGEEWEEIEVGKGLSNYNSWEIDRVKGLKSSQIEGVLGYADSEHVAGNITLRVLA